MSGGKKQNSKSIDFNNPDSLEDIVKEISKEKSKGGGFNPVQKVMTFITSNHQLTIGIAAYIIISGIIGNIAFIINFPLTSILILAPAIFLFLIYKLIKKKNSKKKKKQYVL